MGFAEKFASVVSDYCIGLDIVSTMSVQRKREISKVQYKYNNNTLCTYTQPNAASLLNQVVLKCQKYPRSVLAWEYMASPQESPQVYHSLACKTQGSF